MIQALVLLRVSVALSLKTDSDVYFVLGQLEENPKSRSCPCRNFTRPSTPLEQEETL